MLWRMASDKPTAPPALTNRAVGYVYFGPWRRYCRTMSRRDWTAAQKELTRVRVGLGVILVLGLVASSVSAVGRYI